MNVLAFILGLSLWVDRAPFFPGAYVAPLSVVIAGLALIPITLIKRINIPLPLVPMLLAFWLTSLGVLSLTWEPYYGIHVSERFASFSRQLIALWGGIALMNVVAVLSSSELTRRSLALGVMAGGIVSSIGGLFPRVRGLFGLSNFPDRASGFATEPAHFATMLVIFGLPFAAALLGGARWAKLMGLVGLLIYTLGIALSQSAVGFFLTTVWMVVYLFAGLSKFIGHSNKTSPAASRLFLLALLPIIFSAILAWRKPEYTITQLGAVLGGQATVSFWDRVGGFIGGFIFWLHDPLSLLGYGLGGHGYRIAELLPQELANHILSVKSKAFPALNSLVGRAMSDGGVIAFLLLIVIFLQGIVKAQKAGGPFVATWITVFFAVTIGGQGSWSSPILWFWFAFLTHHQQRRRWHEGCHRRRAYLEA
ncbi:MAG: hypothetical protein KM310_00600 [Clostridiales bacterium]|nr:hypothetical protein [Clostridiales bacterium]